MTYVAFPAPTYMEFAASNGPGTLVIHEVRQGLNAIDTIASFVGAPRAAGLRSGWDMAIQTLTEEQAQEFHAIHNGWIAV